MKKYIIAFLCLLAFFGPAGLTLADLPILPDDTTPPEDTPAPAAEDTPSETVLIRNGNTVIYQGTVNLPAVGTVAIADNTGTAHTVNAKSVLGLLYSIDQASEAFSISNMQYYDSFGSFYLKCITPSGGEAACDNWQYAVNNVDPGTGMDSTVLSGGEAIGLYFGSSHQLIFDTTSITQGGAFTATAQKYNYFDNTWSPLNGVSVGATLPNADDPYSPTVMATQAVGPDGSAAITLDDPNTYTVGIVEDYYFPSYTVTVVAPESGGVVAEPRPFDVDRALAYLKNAQNADGSFGSDLYTDWAAIALGAANDTDAVRANILTYWRTHFKINPLLTDNERYAMALLALGENPYSFEGVDHIGRIADSFDGTQFGDPSLVNDDIFALIPLASSGYTAADVIVAQDIVFILSKQQPAGSWAESIDLTAAAIQALKPFDSASGVSDALLKASAYLSSMQEADGGFDSVYSTSWAAQAMHSLGASWVKNGKTIADYFAGQQAPDGAALPESDTAENRIWATSYAIPAILNKPWNALMRPVSKPEPVAPRVVPALDDNEAPTEAEIAPAPKNIAPKGITPKKVAKKIEVEKPLIENAAPAPDSVLSAAAVGSAVPISTPIAVSGGVVIGLVVYLGKRFLL